MADPWGKRPGGGISSSGSGSTTSNNNPPGWVNVPPSSSSSSSSNTNFNQQQPNFMQPSISGNISNDGRITAPFAPPQPSSVWNPSQPSNNLLGLSSSSSSSLGNNPSMASFLGNNNTNTFQPFTGGNLGFTGQPGLYAGADVVNNLSRYVIYNIDQEIVHK